jgi:NADH dehydrogenase (ubiquinone) Fe-S protein 1
MMMSRLKNFVNIEIDGESYYVPGGETIIQSCFRVGIEVPRFCYHEKLSIAGNCRMCLVELSFPKSIKPVAACALPIIENMRIFTNTVLVKKARESVLEFLLANHPLDCPICDQGGECDLQDQTLIYGSDRGRFYELKRAVQDKECGPLIKTVMTRCIHCTRCVRFCNEVAGISSLGVVGRGSNMEIGMYIESLIKSELSGNIIDLCPVGALTSKPYSFTARPWELRTSETCDILDSFCSSIRVDVRGTEVMRILPLMDKYNNEEWISDRTRFFYDGLKRQRIESPMIRINSVLTPVSWQRALETFLKFLVHYSADFHIEDESYFLNNCNNATRVYGVAGNNLDLHTILDFKIFLTSLIGSKEFFLDNAIVLNEVDSRSSYVLPCSINELLANSGNSKLCVLIDFNPRLELPLFNLSLRKRFLLDNDFLVVTIGEITNLTYYTLHLSQNIRGLFSVIEGRNWFCRKLMELPNPLFFVKTIDNLKGTSSFIMNFFSRIINYVSNSGEKFRNFYSISTNTSQIASGEIGYVGTQNSKLNFEVQAFYYFLSSNYSVMYDKVKCNSIFVYQGHHGDKMAYSSDILLPTPVFTERNGLFLNYYGSLRRTKFILNPPGLARDSWKVFAILTWILAHIAAQGFVDMHDGLFPPEHCRRLRVIYFPSIEDEDYFLFSADGKIDQNQYEFSSGKERIANFVLLNANSNFYITDSITRASNLMSLCSQIFFFSHKNF